MPMGGNYQTVWHLASGTCPASADEMLAAVVTLTAEKMNIMLPSDQSDTACTFSTFPAFTCPETTDTYKDPMNPRFDVTFTFTASDTGTFQSATAFTMDQMETYSCKGKDCDKYDKANCMDVFHVTGTMTP